MINQIMQADLYTHGVRHVFSDDVTKYELLRLIQTSYQHNIEIKPYRDTQSKDSRLRTSYPEFMARLPIPSLRDQIAELPLLSDAKGQWRGEIIS